MSDEKPWEAALRQSIKGELDQALEGQSKFTKDLLEVELMAAVLPHMATSFKVGGMKASARIGSRLVQKNLELSRKLRLARQAVDSWFNGDADRMATEVFRDLEKLFGEEEGPTSAEQEVRAKALEEAAEALGADYSPESGYDRGRAWVIEQLREMAVKGGA